MPSFPLQEWNQVNYWITPAGDPVRLELMLPPLQTGLDWELQSNIPAPDLLLNIVDGERQVLQTNQSVALTGGSLRYRGVRLWLGYQIDYDPLLPWIFVTALIGVTGLGWYFWRKYGNLAAASQKTHSLGAQQSC
jgi:cytochrome c biogenesis protein